MKVFATFSYSLNAGTDIEQGRIVTVDSSGNAVYADATTNPATSPLGVSLGKAKSGSKVLVGLVKGVPFSAVASGAISAGGTVYLANDGKVSASGTNAVGVAVASAANGAYCQVLGY
ncbi:MAG: capsid cement protein [candidate division WOR-3 bacterium]